jgi:hypothetical protein
VNLIMEADMAEIDPVKYGVLWERVQNYERRFDEMNSKMDKMERNVEELLALANKGRGGFWAGMTIASSVGAAVAWFVSHMKAS